MFFKNSISVMLLTNLDRSKDYNVSDTFIKIAKDNICKYFQLMYILIFT